MDLLILIAGYALINAGIFISMMLLIIGTNSLPIKLIGVQEFIDSGLNLFKFDIINMCQGKGMRYVMRVILFASIITTKIMVFYIPSLIIYHFIIRNNIKSYLLPAERI